MRVALPHMGHIWVPFKTAFRQVGVEMIVPPPSSHHSLSLGSQHSPEWACIPFKLTLGNFIEALEMGADTLLMVAGPGLCRFGYYAKTQEQILRDMGYSFQMITTELFESKIVALAGLVKHLSGDAPMPRRRPAAPDPADLRPNMTQGSCNQRPPPRIRPICART